jgi:Kef-type K+ transport system membrane component KefB
LSQAKNHRLEEVCTAVGIFFNFFLAGLKMDVGSMWHAGKKTVIIAVIGISIPMMITLLTYLCIHNQINYHVSNKHNILFFLAATICHSFFFVQAEVLSDLGIVGSELGRLALSASLIQDLIIYSLIPLFNGVTQINQIGKETVIMHLFFYVIMVLFIILIIRPYALWVARNTPSNARVRYISHKKINYLNHPFCYLVHIFEEI